MKKCLGVLMVLIASISLSGCWDTGGGEKIGVITKLAKSGAICKTWEGQIVRGGMSGGSGVMGASFDFTVEDDALAKKVQNIMDKQQEVKVTYRTEMNTFCRSESGDHFLTNIEVIHQGATPITPEQVSSNAGAYSPMPPAINTQLDRQKIADEIIRQNGELLKQNQQLIDLLKK